jgi:hypothetical protein
MILLLTLAFPGVLLALMLAMERVESPLRGEALGDQLVNFLDTARPDEVETFVSEGLAPALDRYWRRRSLRNRLLLNARPTRRLVARS